MQKYSFTNKIFSIGYTAFAHNARSFDAVLIEKWLVSHNFAKFEATSSGMKVLELREKNSGVTLRDTLNFFMCPLAKLPSMFGLESAEKGDFPHLFNTEENRGKITDWPDRSFYGYETKTKQQKKDFDAW